MSVYDTATKLASEIKNSKEYLDFVDNMKIIKKNKNKIYEIDEYCFLSGVVRRCVNFLYR